MSKTIDFIEKDVFELPPLPFNQNGDKAVPVFMVKDGKKYFMLNRTTEKQEHYDTEHIKLKLAENSGDFFKFYGGFDSPFEFVSWVLEKKYSFESSGKDGRVFNDVATLFDDCRNIPGYGAGFIDFHGNIREVSCAFSYRIYDVSMVEALKSAIGTEVR